MTEPTEPGYMILEGPSLFTVRESSTGLGAFSRGNFPEGTIILESEGPDIVVLNEAEVDRICTWCFKYNRYEPWTVTINERPDLIFCCESCKIKWYGKYELEGFEAYVAVKKFLRKRRNEHVVVEETDSESELRPEDIKKAWQEVEEQVKRILAFRKGQSPPSDVLKKALRQPVIDPECMMLLLDGLLCRTALNWVKVDTLKASDPWRDVYTLIAATRAYLHLYCILPLELLDKGHLKRKLVERILAVDIANSFGINQPSADKIIGRGVWTDASFFNHSCSPNLTRYRYGRRRVFKARRDIREGEELCITYMKSLDARKADYSERRMRLLATLGFVCQCASCKQESLESLARRS